MHVSKPRRPNPDGFQASLGPTTMAAKTLPHDFQVLQPPEMKTPPPSDSTPTSTTNQDPSSPPAALTVVLSVACGAVATCILLTVRTPRPKKKTRKEKEKRAPLAYATYSGKHSTILFQIILLLLRHRSYKQAFRQGQRASFRATTAAAAGDKAPTYIAGETRADSSSDGTVALTLNTPDAVVAYLPILHSSSPSTETLTPAGHRYRTLGPGRALSLTYPKRVHLGLSRSGMGMSLPSQIV